MNKKCIGIIGGCKGVGATFFANSLAFSMAEMTDGVTYIESPMTNLNKEEPLAINELSLERLVSKKAKLYENICWYLHEEWQKGAFIEMDLEKIGGRYIIYDSPVEYRKCDLIICVIDSLPSRVLASINKVNHLNAYFGSRVLWVLNRGRKEDAVAIERVLKIKFDFIIPMENQESFYKAERLGRPLQKTKYISRETQAAVLNVAKYIASLY